MTKLSFALFLGVMTLVLYGVNRRALRWLGSSFQLSPRTERAIVWLLTGSLLIVLLGRLLSLVFPALPLGALVGIGFGVQLAALVSVILLLPLDLLLLTRRALRRVPGMAAPEAPAAPADASATRRAFLTQASVGSAFLIGSSSSMYGTLVGRHDYQLEDVPLHLPGLPRALDGFRIVQLSDLHIGQFVGDPELAAAEELVRQARPDLIVLTGDLLDNDPLYAEKLGRFARRLGPLAREGVVAISGNHDFYAGISQTVDALRAGGADVLRNRGRIIGGAGGGFALLGVDDVWGTRLGMGPDLDAAVRSLTQLSGSEARARELPRVLLCHNPSFFEKASGHVGLQLSGHTHGGQFNLLVRPADWVLKNGWVAGQYQANGSRLYVNRGFGTAGPPARVGAPPEITRVILTA